MRGHTQGDYLTIMLFGGTQGMKVIDQYPKNNTDVCCV